MGKGDFVVLFLPNCIDYVFAWFALAKLGAVEVTVGNDYKGEFLRHQASLSGSPLIVTTPALAPRLVEIEDALPQIRHCILVDDGEPHDEPPRFARITTSAFADLYDDDASDLGVQVSPRDLSLVLFTSGTTGLSKGVLMSHSQFYFFAEEDVQLTRLTDRDVYSTAFPLFHGNAQFLTVYPCLIAGAHCVLYRRFSASDFFGRIRRSGATVCNLLGATMTFILAQPPSPEDKAHRLSRIYAAPLAPDLATKFVEQFGDITFVDGFGQTEISNVFQTPWRAPRPAGASGVLMDQFFEVKLADPDTDEEVADGEIGELLVRHKLPNIVCEGYLGMPEKTVETWRNLWFHTGDAMRRDPQGWYYFVDRVKDALRRRGENISFEVESVVRSHPAVAECAVVAAPGIAALVLSAGQGVDMDTASLDAALATPFSLAGRRILVTGAAGGIGIAAAQVCLAQGADLVLTDIVDEDRARARLGGVPEAVLYHPADLSRRDAVDALAAATGPVIAVIDTAGLCPQDDWTADDWDGAFDAVIGANVKGPINLARAFMPGMIAAGGGRFAICGSVSGRMGGVVCGPHYAASKGGVHALVRWLAQRGAAHNVLVNAIAPGSFDTPMAAANKVPTDHYPLRRKGRPLEAGATLAFLCSPAAGFISGAVIDVNGATYFG